MRTPWIVLTLLAGCTPAAVGVESVHVSLHPTMFELPIGLTGQLQPSAFVGASGTLHTDVPVGTLDVEALELPELPDSWVYLADLRFAANARAGLPEPGAEEGGHGHGVDEGAPPEEAEHDEEEADGDHDEDEGGGTVLSPALAPFDHDGWTIELTAEGVAPFELGALRGGSILVAPAGTTNAIGGTVILDGNADFSGEGTDVAPGEEEAGHGHGI